jgi:hypothetical protein
MHDENLWLQSLYQSCENAKNRLQECAIPTQAREEDSPRLISLKGPARARTAIRKKRMVTPAPDVPEQFLRSADVGANLQHGCPKRMAKGI